MKQENIRFLRTHIDKIDKTIIELLTQRMELAYRIGVEKGRSGQAVTVPEREKEIIESLNNVSSPYITCDDLKILFNHIILLGRKAGEMGALAITKETEK